MRLVVGICEAAGTIYGVKALQALRASNVETHLILTESAKRTLERDTKFTVTEVEKLADYIYDNKDDEAPIATDSFKTDGMLIAPCTVKCLSALANTNRNSLLLRIADFMLKEKRKLVLIPFESPLLIEHLKLMLAVAQMGAVVLPPMPAYYHRPKTVDDIICQTVGKALDQFNIDHQLFTRWGSAEFSYCNDTD